jgi:hypothetical protein
LVTSTEVRLSSGAEAPTSTATNLARDPTHGSAARAALIHLDAGAR